MSSSNAVEIRQQLSHPVIDCDGHWIEPIPVLIDYVREVGGASVTDKFVRDSNAGWYLAGTKEERFKKRVRRWRWWPDSNDALDFSTARLPGLLRERMDGLGIDFSIVYPTIGLTIESIPDPELRHIVVRAFNQMTADFFRPFKDRMAPVAVIPRFSPQEAMAEAEYAVRELGFRALMINGAFLRSVPAGRERGTKERYLETLGLDNQVDFDPLWQKCVELGVAVTSHGGASSWQNRTSVSNYVYNHIGHFAEANHAFAKAIFLGGVTKRFPTLNFAFLEGGVGWGCNLYNDLVGHWEKRSLEPLQKHLRPDRLDQAKVKELIDCYGHERMAGRADELVASYVSRGTGLTAEELTSRETELDDFANIGVHSKRELVELYSRNFCFGCEADDPMTMLAFDPRLRARLKAVFSSDFSHWDVPVMADVVPEAYELVEHGLVNEKDFRDFAFANAVWLHGRNNKDFFKGTVIEQEAGKDIEAQLAADQAKSSTGAKRWRIRRSMLLVPANVERMVSKAHDLDVDVVTLDLQDGVPNRDEDKRIARDAAAKAIREGGFRARELSVRVNGPRTGWFLEDVAAMVQAGADSIKLTHARGLADVLFADGYLRALSGGRKVEIILSVEFPETILALPEIARHAGLITGLQVSPGDYSLEMRASPELAREVGLSEDEPLAGVRYQILLAARASGWNAIDARRRGTDPRNLDSVRLSMQQARALGFDGVNLLHPTHIPVANEVFGPSAEEKDWADKVIAAFEAAEQGRAVGKLADGQLVSPPTYLKARQMRAYIEAIDGGAKDFTFGEH